SGIALGVATTAPRAIVSVRRSLVVSGSSQDGFPLKKFNTIKKGFVFFLSWQRWPAYESFLAIAVAFG
ncbi:MAG: hypothetical protein QF607_07165, partial [Nitrospinaceae bacterium]|nr:hypothetical protein [Nitrospinaceae bacterium]